MIEKLRRLVQKVENAAAPLHLCAEDMQVLDAEIDKRIVQVRQLKKFKRLNR